MSKICYVPARFEPKTLRTIKQANEILDEYNAQGFVLTLRQLYYQFVARGLIPNNQKSYERLQELIAKARLAGHIDWEMIEDRTRNLMELNHYLSAQDGFDRLARSYGIDMWEKQPYRPEVWIEKDALIGVIQDVCHENDIPYFSCRGYTSLSEMWRASLRFREYMEQDQPPYIIHFGDHDPSGIDMSRDIYDRINNTFMSDCKFNRVALTMDQVEKYQPPPNPAKVTDSRYEAYVSQYGDESWELDALQPAVFRQLVEKELKKLRNQKQWDKDVAECEATRNQLVEVKDEWEMIGHNKQRLTKAAEEYLELKYKYDKLMKNYLKTVPKKRKKK